MAELEVPRVLGCRTHYEVLTLAQPDTASVLVDSQQVRKRYKELAIRVHPDKNRSADAEAAFKRLSEAYECLVDELSQRSYLQKLRAQQPKTRTKTAHPPKYKRKRKTHSETRTEGEAPLPRRRRRTPEEVWQEFQREEEKLARQKFHAKGFDRVYESAPKRTSGVKSTTGKSESPHAVPLEEQQDILDSNLDAKARQWTTWSKTSSTQTRTESATMDTAAGGDDAPVGVICCMLCRRKFQTVEALGRHEVLSKLHLANVQAQRAAQSDDGP